MTAQIAQPNGRVVAKPDLIPAAVRAQIEAGPPVPRGDDLVGMLDAVEDAAGWYGLRALHRLLCTRVANRGAVDTQWGYAAGMRVARDEVIRSQTALLVGLSTAALRLGSACEAAAALSAGDPRYGADTKMRDMLVLLPQVRAQITAAHALALVMLR